VQSPSSRTETRVSVPACRYAFVTSSLVKRRTNSMKSSGHPQLLYAAATNRRALAALGATEGKTVENSSVDFSLLPPPRRARLVSAVTRPPPPATDPSCD
jgi:hypothetical protein